MVYHLSEAHLNEVVLTKLGDHDTLQSHYNVLCRSYNEWDGNVLAVG